MNGTNALVDKSFLFAIRIVTIYKILTQDHKEYVLSKQLLRSGTAIGALIREAQNAESKPDFVHKLAVSQKECDETIYWIDLLNATDYLKESDYKLLNEGTKELLRILRSSIITTKQRMNKPVNL
jgi:four helix bundle protein